MDNESQTEFGKISFKPIQFFSKGFIIVLVWIGAICAGGFIGMKSAGVYSYAHYFSMGVLALLISALFFRYFLVSKVPSSIQFTKNSMRIPRWNGSKISHDFPYSDIKSIDVRGEGKWQILVIGTRKKNYIFPLTAIVESREEIEKCVKSALLGAADGEQLWSHINDAQKNVGLLMRYKSPAVIILVAAIALIYVASRLSGVGSNVLDLVLLGGNSPVLVNQGQWDRLFVSNFLHTGLLHIYFNLFALFIFGAILEKILGWKKFIVVFLVSSLCAAAASYFAARSLVSVGSSGGVFGLMGSLFLINVNMGSRLPAGFNLGRQTWIILILLNGGLPFFVPLIDWVAHLGGFLSGVCVTWLMLRKHMSHTELTESQLHHWRANSVGRTTICFVLMAVFLLSFAVRIASFGDHPKDVDQLVPAVMAGPDISAESLNELAWSLVTDRSRSAESLSFAKQLMQPVLDDLEPSSAIPDLVKYSQYIDTYAAILFLQREYVAALLYEYKAMDMSSEPYYATQISRFLAAINKNQGVWIRGSVAPADLSIRESENEVVLVRSGAPVPVSVTIQVHLSGIRKGYFECAFVDDTRELSITSRPMLFDVNRNALSFDIAAIDTQRVSGSEQSACNSYAVDGTDDIEMKSFLKSFL